MRQVVSYQPLLNKEDYAEGIVGQSEPMQQVFKLIGQVSQSDATVLITGESGTGKELVARAIYHHSPRADQSFMAINCAAIPKICWRANCSATKGAPSPAPPNGASANSSSATSGTIFLDEIGDMPLSTQTKILRVLQNGEFQRVGGNQTFRRTSA